MSWKDWKNYSFWKRGKDLKVDLEHKSVKVIYDPRKTTEEKLNKAIEDLDYTFKKVEDKTTWPDMNTLIIWWRFQMIQMKNWLIIWCIKNKSESNSIKTTEVVLYFGRWMLTDKTMIICKVYPGKDRLFYVQDSNIYSLLSK